MQALLEVVREAARAGARAAVEARERGGLEAVGVGRGGDISLRGDVAAEDAVLEVLKRRVGSFTLVTEERGGVRVGEGSLVFVVDPLDGSRNYKRGIPFFSTSVAAALKPSLSNVVAAAVHAPLLNMEFYAERGGGAYLNGRKLAVEQPTGDLVVAVSTVPKATFLPHALTLELSRRGFVIRHLGAASLELALVAAGGVDAYFDPWFVVRAFDVAASFLVVREAGAWVRVEGKEGSDPKLSTSERLSVLAAATEELARELSDALKSALGFAVEEAREFLGSKAERPLDCEPL